MKNEERTNEDLLADIKAASEGRTQLEPSERLLYNEAVEYMNTTQQKYIAFCNDVLKSEYNVPSGAQIRPDGSIEGSDTIISLDHLSKIIELERLRTAGMFHYKMVEQHVQRVNDMGPKDQLDKHGVILREGRVADKLKQIIKDLPKEIENGEH